ncbi:MAG: class I SAM-dependent methyltransferase [Anaerolineales bacterium]|nr:class I SAM-dependent methyltransferase [Anaerolineales bacterium]
MKNSLYTDGEYARNNPQCHAYDSPWKVQQILAMLTRHGIQPDTVCDIGCGAGEILRHLQLQMGANTRFFGYDISPQAIELCKHLENDRLSFFCEDLLLKKGELFDVLLCIDVFEHVEDYLDFLRRLRSKAKLKIFHIPLEMCAVSVVRGSPIVQNRKLVGHLHYFMKDTALMALKETGYTILDYNYTPSGISRARGVGAKLARIPRILVASIHRDFAARVLGGFSLLVLAE